MDKSKRMFPLAKARKNVRISRLPSYRVENELDSEAMPQYFQVSVNVLEARKLVWSKPEQMNSFVLLSVGNKRRRTALRKHMEQPFYGEYFVFEMLACARDIQMLTASFTVMEPRCCMPHHMLGQAIIDLSAVWIQPHHQIFHKWAQLTIPKDPLAGPHGFLKIDIGILCRGEVQYIPPPSTKDDTLEGNLLPASNHEQQRANYLISIFKAWGLPNSLKNEGGRNRHYKPPTTFVRITFCGLVVKTSVQVRSNSPSYNEQISVTEMFPNLNQHVHIEVCSTESCCNRILCSTYLKLDEISHDGENGFLPTFGPSALHMYNDGGRSTGCVSEDGPYYRGSLLLSFRTLVPYNKQGLRNVSVEPISPVREEDFWTTEDFYLFFSLLEVSMLDKRLVGKTCGISITMGESYAEKDIVEETQHLYEEIKQNKSYYSEQMQTIWEAGPHGFVDLLHKYPVLQLMMHYPDFRMRMFRNNMVTRIIADIERMSSDVSSRLSTHDYETLEELNDALERALDDVSGGIRKFLDIENSSNTRIKKEDNLSRSFTELDEKQLDYQKSEMMRILQELNGRSNKKYSFKLSSFKIFSQRQIKSDSDMSRKRIKLKLADTKLLIQKLNKLVFKTTEGFPDIVIWLISKSTKVAYVKLSPADIIYSPVEEQCGRKCAKFHTLFMKPIKCPKHLTSIATGCFCIAAKIQTAAWFGLLRQKTVVPSLLPDSYEVNVSGSAGLANYVTANPINIECRAYIHRAKLNSGADSSGLANSFVRVNIFSQSAKTQVLNKTLTPVWNQTLRIQRLTYSSLDRFQSNPESVLIEVWDRYDRDKEELMGRVQIKTPMSDEVNYTTPPKIQSFDLYKGKLCAGQILMSVELFKITEITEAKIDEIEPLPESLKPQYTTYKIDVYWWGLRGVAPKRKLYAVLEIDDLAIKSDAIMENKANINFLNGKHTEIFEAPLKETYCPPLSIRLYDSGTFGRTIFLGTNVLKSPSKFIVDWLPKIERDASLHTTSFEVFEKSIERDPSSKNSIVSSVSEKPEIVPQKPVKSKLRSLFSRTQTVAVVTSVKKSGYKKLPVVKKSKQSAKVNQEVPVNDWWIRFSCSQKECFGETLRKGDKIMIYNSELEKQEGFSNFKDWCHTLKMYKGKKTGVPEEDEKLYSGFLKAGIAIYKWPPPKNMVAVSRSGVDLDKGFFYDHPNNETRRFLVRVYIVKGLNLMPKDFSGKSDPYVLVKCGKKQLGDRKHYIPKNLNPIFGRMFEFRAVLPDDYLLTVSVYDYDKCSCSDDFIGSTVIDIENRIFTKHRATCGLASEYCLSGYNKWRDAYKPSAILNQLCRTNHLPPPVFSDYHTVLINGVQYKDHEKGDYKSDVEKKENLCLNLLKKWSTLPLCGHEMVPEHVETRTLYNPEKPGLDQGKLQMWIDIFPLDEVHEIPFGVDITPKKPEHYELRVIVWNVQGITLDDYDFISGEKASDIYVKAWIGDPENAQTTDIHYRSLTGEGNFNWRMVFRFQYNRAERRLVFTDTSDWFAQEDVHIPPTLHAVVMDNDFIKPDDFLGSLSLTLDSMPRGAKSPRYCSLANRDKMPQINLFNTGTVRGWWPFSTIDPVTGKPISAGMADLEINLLTKEKAAMQPSGLGREPPQSLPEPKRPETSFSAWANPFGSLKRMLKKRGWKAIVYALLVAVLGLMLFATIMDIPKVILEKLID